MILKNSSEIETDQNIKTGKDKLLSLLDTAKGFNKNFSLIYLNIKNLKH